MQIKLELPPRATKTQQAVIDSEWFGMDAKRLHRPTTGHFACATICYMDQPETVYLVDDERDMPETIRRITPASTWIMQNAVFDLTQFRRFDPVPEHRIFDTMLVEHELYSGYYDTFSLKDMMRRYFGEIMDKETRDKFSDAKELTSEMIQYAARDTVSTARVAIKQMGELKDPMANVYAVIDEPMIWATMDFKGFYFDKEAWTKLAQENQAKEEELEKGFDFNPRSNPQTLAALHKSGLKTLKDANAKSLARYKDKPLVKQLLAYRGIQKMASTYGMDFLDWVEADGRIHAAYNIYGTLTGRFSSSDPNLQNIPKKDCYRSSFTCPKDMILIKGDFSAQEPRILAYRSQDPVLLQIVNSGGDIHTETAKIIYKDKTIQKSDIRRKKSKAVGLGLDYGMTWRGLMQARDLVESGIYLTEEEAKELIAMYFGVFQGVKDCISDDRRTAREQEYVETLMGRKCWVNLYNYKGMNNAINSPNQGSGGDMIKLALKEIHRHWPSEFGPSGIVETTHDSISIEVPKEMKKQGMEFLRESMLAAANIVCPNFPFAVDVEAGRTWGEEKDD